VGARWNAIVSGALPRPIAPDPSPQGYGRTGMTRTWHQWHDAIEGARTPRHIADDIVAACTRRHWIMLPRLAREAAVWAIVRPSGTAALPDIGAAVIEAVQTVTAHDDGLVALAMVDILNVIRCVGGDFDGKWHLKELMPELARRSSTWTPTQQTRVRCAAWLHRDLDTFRALCGRDKPYDGSLQRVPHDALVPHLVAAAANNEPRPLAWTFVLHYLDELSDQGLIDPETLLFLARIFARTLAEPDRVAIDLHDQLASIARGQDTIEGQRRYQISNPHGGTSEAPFGDTLADGAFRVDEHVFGVRRWRQYLGHQVTQPGERVVVSCLWEGTPKVPYEQLRADLAYSIPGVLEVVFLGRFDTPEDAAHRKELNDWSALVERLPSGLSARRAITSALDADAAARLGAAVGAIVQRAAGAGVLLTALRPEYIWVERDARGEWHPTGLTARNSVFFASHKFGEYPSLAPFLRQYGAPEAIRAPTERSLVFTLATLIAEWTTGRYPFLDAWDRNLRRVQVEVDRPEEPDLRGAPPELAELLARGLAKNEAARPTLSGWLGELNNLIASTS